MFYVHLNQVLMKDGGFYFEFFFYFLFFFFYRGDEIAALLKGIQQVKKKMAA